MNLHSKRILIVGVSKGMGRSLAKQLLQQKCQVIGFSRKAELLKQEFSEYVEKGLFIPVTGDVRKPETIDALETCLASLPGPIDGLMYVAGVSRPDFIEKLDVERAIDTLRVNLEGPFRLFYRFLPMLIDRPDTFILGFTSMAGDRGMPRAHAYTASKAGLDRLLESLRIDLWNRKTQVFTVVPGYVETPMSAQNDFPMPGMWPCAKATRHILERMERNQPVIRFPWYHSLPMRLLAMLPDRLYCRLMNLQREQVRIRAQADEEFQW